MCLVTELVLNLALERELCTLETLKNIKDAPSSKDL